MLRVRAVSAIYIESQALEIFSPARRDVFKLFRTRSLTTQAPFVQYGRRPASFEAVVTDRHWRRSVQQWSRFYCTQRHDKDAAGVPLASTVLESTGGSKQEGAAPSESALPSAGAAPAPVGVAPPPPATAPPLGAAAAPPLGAVAAPPLGAVAPPPSISAVAPPPPSAVAPPPSPMAPPPPSAVASPSASVAAPPPQSAGAPPPPTCESAPSPPPPPPQSLRSWVLAATAITVTASLGGAYLYQKLSEDNKAVNPEVVNLVEVSNEMKPEEEAPIPSSGADIPGSVQFLLVGAGTASFAAMRAIRSARPDARVLMVGAEHELPYMRPPLSKELWREPDLAERAPHLDALSFRQWNGRRRTVAYEPSSFYTPVQQLPGSEGGAAVARGWRVARLDAVRHEAELRAPGRPPVTVRYDKCLVATGVRARRTEALRDAAAAGRALALRGVRDAARLARELDRPGVGRVAVLGGGFLASELSAALAERLRPDGRSVLQLFREDAPLAAVLPPYLAAEAARRVREAGVTLLPRAEVLRGAVEAGGVTLRLASGEDVRADLVVECVGSEVDDELARASDLETHPELGGLLVNAELQARSDVYAAGDVACFYDVVLGRRRVEHHDHAVVSGRLAGENMAGVAPPKHYTHQSMFWSDLGPQLGYEAIGVIDSRLPTVGVFSADAVADSAASVAVESAASGVADSAASGVADSAATVVADSAASVAVDGAVVAVLPAPPPPEQPHRQPAPAGESDAATRRYERGVVFYLRDERVVGVLLWNLFNRMHVARQVLAQGEFEDLFEVAKLFSLHEDE